MTARTWIGGGASLATDPNNWSPTGIPQLGDTLAMAGGTMDVTGNDLAGDTLTLTGTDVVNVTGSTDMTLATGFDPTTGSPLNATVNLQPGSDWVGTLTQPGGGIFGPITIQGAGTFDNEGTSNVNDAIIGTDVTGTGSFSMFGGRSGGHLEFANGVSAGQTVVETGTPTSGGSHVVIDDPADFQAEIDLQYSDVVLLGLTADSYTFANGAVTLWSGQTVVDTIKVTAVDAPSPDFFPPMFGVSQVIGGIDIHDDGANVVHGTLLGLHVAPSPATPPPAPTPTPTLAPTQPTPSGTPVAPVAPVAQTNFTVTDTTTGTTSLQPGTPYSGPVAGLTNEIVMTTPDSLNITATTPNSFIHTGAGNDAISVSAGANVLDGSTGSNFLSGGSGDDTFFLDDRGPSADLWSTVVGFHTGDTATIWGVTQAGF
jgi:Ca2+-binding RTX toxin-like protein